MKSFAELFARIDQTNQTNEKVALLTKYFQQASSEDQLWVLALLMNKRPKKPVKTSLLKKWAAEVALLPDWLFEESYHVVGDLAETIALVLPPPTQSDQRTLAEWMQFIQLLAEKEETEQKKLVLWAWDCLGATERFLFNKLIGGSFRVGVSEQLVIRALSLATNIDAAILSHRLMGDWMPDQTTLEALLYAKNNADNFSQPYPFCLAHPLEENLETLGKPEEWLAEWKWDGIRGQVIVRGGQIYLWSRGEELITEKFPELHGLKYLLPAGTVLDGEILAWKKNKPLPFADLQTRITRKKLTKKHLADVPVIFLAYDLLEWKGEDWRNTPLAQRRKQLEEFYDSLSENPEKPLYLSPTIEFSSWADLAQCHWQARSYEAEGLMLKRKSSPYHVGRKKGDWWKWKVHPFVIDAVLVYAQKGHGRRANLYTDYTFAVWKDQELIVFTKAYSGLTDSELREVDAFIQQNTLEKFGPVRTVTPHLVFEIAFEGIQRSSRHKSGVALRFPRISRWRRDKKPEEANTLDDLLSLLSHR